MHCMRDENGPEAGICEPFDTALDFMGGLKTDGRGMPFSISGEDELLQRAGICLSVPMGSFVYESGLGSRLRETSDRRSFWRQPGRLFSVSRRRNRFMRNGKTICVLWSCGFRGAAAL